jgi:SOS response regulatory protein OraA/RecX
MRRVTPTEDSTSERACYDSALRILAGRGHSAFQLQKKLSAKGFDAEVVSAVIARLRGEKWISDEVFAAEFARSRGRRQQGSRRIQKELEVRGVSREAVAAAVAALEEHDPEEGRLEGACARKIVAMRRRMTVEELREESGRKKLAAFLLKQGYDAADIIDEVDRQLKELRIKNQK